MNQALASNDPDHIAEQIVAYLDGELAPDEVRAVESCLASDERYREALRSLQRSWDMLDVLPRTDADQRFAASTVEMVALSAVDHQGYHVDGWAKQVVRQWTIAGFSVLAACLLGFSVTTAVAALLGKAGLIEGTNDALLRDAAVIENMDKYKLVPDIEFLRAYAELPRLPAAESTESKLVNLNESAEQLGARLQQLPPARKEQLLIKQERFAELKRETQQQLREFHSALVQDPQAQQLRRALDEYHQWYLSLPLEQRIDLRTLPSEDLMKHVAFSHNLRAVLLWLEMHAARYEASLIKGSHSLRQDQFAKLTQEMKRRRLMSMLWARWVRQGAPMHPPVTEEEMRTLVQSLSPDVRRTVAAAGGVEQQWTMLVQTLTKKWGAKFTPTTTAAAALAPNAAYLPESQMQSLRMMAYAMQRQEALMKFFRESLTPAERQRLERLPVEKRFQQLQHLYKSRFQRGSQRGSTINRRFDGPGALSNVRPDRTMPNTGASIKPKQPQAVRPDVAPATDLRSTLPRSDRPKARSD